MADKSAITLERMESFVRVAERGQVSAVARELGVGQATVSRHLAELERALGVSLLSRTTRRITLTDEGARYLVEARRILSLVEEASEGVARAGSEAGGMVRVSCTAALGVRHVCDLVFKFQDRHPGIHVDLSLSDAAIDLVGEGVDFSIRLGPVADSGLRRRMIGRSTRMLVASRDYVARYGQPETPADLAGHRGVRMMNVADGDTLALTDAAGGTAHAVFDGPFRTDHGLAARTALAAGRGIAAAHVWLCDDLLASGAVVEVLPGHRPYPVPLAMLVVPGRERLRRVRLLIDHLAVGLAALPGIEAP